MVYTIIVNNMSYDLPPMTITVEEELTSIIQIDNVKGLSLRQKYSKIHDYIKKMLGEENAKEVLGSDELEQIDTRQLCLVVHMIKDAYDKPLQDYKQEKTRQAIDALPTEKLISMTKAAQTVANAKALER